MSFADIFRVKLANFLMFTVSEGNTVNMVKYHKLLVFGHRSLIKNIKQTAVVNIFITCRAKLLKADWLRQRAFFFLNQEGTFGNQKGQIT